MASAAHFEPYLHLAGLTGDAALISWGGFWFEEEDGGRLRRRTTARSTGSTPAGRHIGVRSSPTGRPWSRPSTPTARSSPGPHRRGEPCVAGRPEEDTEYRYRVLVDGEPWAEGPRRDWRADPRRPAWEPDRAYDCRFRTLPSRRRRARSRSWSSATSATGSGETTPLPAASGRWPVPWTWPPSASTPGSSSPWATTSTSARTRRRRRAGGDLRRHRRRGRRLVLLLLPALPVPVEPAALVPRHRQPRRRRDRAERRPGAGVGQLLPRPSLHLGRRSGPHVGRTGALLQLRRRGLVDFVAVDTTEASDTDHKRYFSHPDHRRFLEKEFPDRGGRTGDRPVWHLPFSHHPAFCAGPSHFNDQAMIDELLPLYRRAGVRVVWPATSTTSSGAWSTTSTSSLRDRGQAASEASRADGRGPHAGLGGRGPLPGLRPRCRPSEHHPLRGHGGGRRPPGGRPPGPGRGPGPRSDRR